MILGEKTCRISACSQTAMPTWRFTFCYQFSSCVSLPSYVVHRKWQALRHFLCVKLSALSHTQALEGSRLVVKGVRAHRKGGDKTSRSVKGQHSEPVSGGTDSHTAVALMASHGAQTPSSHWRVSPQGGWLLLRSPRVGQNRGGRSSLSLPGTVNLFCVYPHLRFRWEIRKEAKVYSTKHFRIVLGQR